ncbi:response regulator transcription factor [Teichococcus wenyumeiae]|uniref:response regulator transcription factor n=1 Tax=Teichococcus wenyumeiae TaxID=2478470 RepID=UPI0011C364FD|nr:response regulator transcription factor [Pseudoroseomonas wenyumeiae]
MPVSTPRREIIVYIAESSAAAVRPQAQVAVVSPQQLYLDALQRLLTSTTYKIVGAGRTLEEALQDKMLDGPLSLVVYNLEADDDVEEELDKIKAIHRRFPFAKSVLLANCRRTSTKLKIMQAGIEAILSRDISIDVLRSSLELVLLGKCIMPAELTRPLFLQDQNGAEAAAPPVLPPLPPPSPVEVMPRQATRESALLSCREHQILQCLINGLTNKAIARDLDISEATVKVHVKALLRKTRLANRTQAAIWALNNAPESKLLTTARAAEDGAAPSWLADEQDAASSQALSLSSEVNVERIAAPRWRDREPGPENRAAGTSPQGAGAPVRGNGYMIADDIP